MRFAMRLVGVVLITAFCLATPAFGQFIEDALRFSTPGVGSGARALGMGGAYNGVASDFSALYWNPAGLAQLQHGEFSFGLSYLNYGDKGMFLGNAQSLSSNALKLNTLGIAYPVPVRRGSLVLAFGYNRQSDFTTGVSFTGFNPSGSIIQAWAPDSSFYPEEITLAEDLKLAIADTNTGRFNSPIRGMLTQLGKATEEGGLSNWSAGAAVDVAKNLAIGITVSYVTGTYKYSRSYREQDNNGMYSQFPFDFDELVVQDDVTSDLSGVNARFGLMYREPDRFRLGITIKTPTSFRVKETFNTTAQSYFDNGDTFGPFDAPGSNEYDVVTPWVFGAGLSVIVESLVLSGDVEYTDWTQTEFQDANQDLLNKNRDIKEFFRATANLRGGLEYQVENVGLRIRGGFMYSPSPYEGDPSSYDQKHVTAGLGIPLGSSSMLDLGYARGWWDTRRINYDGSPDVTERITTNNFVATISVRF
jgi:long-subunit fatty acid transport protein